MTNIQKPYGHVEDYITGRQVPDIGAEANRQAVERFLVEKKGYDKTDIAVDADISFSIEGETYRSQIDLVVSAGGRPAMLIKCPAGSLGSCEKEVIAAASILAERPLPYAAASDGRSAVVWDAVSGKKIGETLDAVPDKSMLEKAAVNPVESLPEKTLEKYRLIYRTYDKDYVNVQRKMPPARE